jgi:hypothetical protein
MVAVAVHELVQEAIEEEGMMRLSELADELEHDRAELYKPIMTRVEHGDLAVFPMGDTVQIRDESGD